ncbi:hypothetical protein VP1G_10545 [Cytospora mali]|uniref:Uncharacterized protein n=1 Tax=Cytospora mali TaxID=578113 RepID=A0A194UMX4_CYTMA|nr:hypothetical protein VP1G_10545 [Valsa mali var. pyri (nom. inval.)]
MERLEEAEYPEITPGKGELPPYIDESPHVGDPGLLPEVLVPEADQLDEGVRQEGLGYDYHEDGLGHAQDAFDAGWV